MGASCSVMSKVICCLYIFNISLENIHFDSTKMSKQLTLQTPGLRGVYPIYMYVVWTGILVDHFTFISDFWKYYPMHSLGHYTEIHLAFKNAVFSRNLATWHIEIITPPEARRQKQYLCPSFCREFMKKYRWNYLVVCCKLG